MFASLTEAELQALAARTSRKRFAHGEHLFAEGDACTGLFQVASGKIRIFKLSPSGREQVLAIEGPGSSFAELPVFDGGNYPAAASALEETEVLFISRKDFQNFCREHPDVALKVIAVVGSRLRRLVGIIEELSFTTVRQRLIVLLIRLAQASGVRSEEGIHIELTKSHQDLAAELGTVRELVSRNLSRLQAEGFLEVEGRKIVIKDLAGLAASRRETRVANCDGGVVAENNFTETVHARRTAQSLLPRERLFLLISLHTVEVALKTLEAGRRRAAVNRELRRVMPEYMKL